MNIEEVRKLLGILSRRYAIEIIQLIESGKRTPTHFKSALNITEGSLYQVLNPLLDSGVVVKKRSKRDPKGVEYYLTEKGELVAGIIKILSSIR